MARTPSTMRELGTNMPSFTLTDAVSGSSMTFGPDDEAAATLVMFICNHCPFVVHVRDEFTRIDRDFAGRGLRIIAINANPVETYPQDGPDQMKALATELGWSFPFLYDGTQDVARAFDAACTPDFFVYNNAGLLAYRGQLDGSRPGNDVAVDGADLRSALDALLDGKAPSENQKPSIGCNIKWRTPAAS